MSGIFSGSNWVSMQPYNIKGPLQSPICAIWTANISCKTQEANRTNYEPSITYINLRV